MSAPGVEPEQRLIEQYQLVAVAESFAQIVLELELLGGLVEQRRLEQYAAVAAAALRSIHGHISRPDEVEPD